MSCENCQYNVGVCIGRFYGVEIDACKQMLLGVCVDWMLSFAVYQDNDIDLEEI